MDRRIHMAGNGRAHLRVRVPSIELRAGNDFARRPPPRSGRGEEKVISMGKTLSLVLVTGMLLFVSTASLVAHHAFGSEFDPNRPVLLKGKIVRIEWVNPHAWIH